VLAHSPPINLAWFDEAFHRSIADTYMCRNVVALRGLASDFRIEAKSWVRDDYSDRKTRRFRCRHNERNHSARAAFFVPTFILDFLASASAGVASPLAQTALRAGRKLYGHGESTAWFTEARSSWLGAAYINSFRGQRAR
jgi:hypothetical protein